MSIHSDTSAADALNLENEKLKRLSENPPTEIFVVSDFHLCFGRNPETGRFSRTENFLSDQAFCRFLDYVQPGPQKLLYINGDTFDFVRICRCPQDRELAEWSSFLEQLGVAKTPAELKGAIFWKEKKFGLETDDYKSAWKLLQIAKGHPDFFDGLANWINGGGYLLLAKGNHDLELYWPLVRKAFGELLRQHGANQAALTAQMFYCDDSLAIANVYFEHGHRYDPQQSIDDGDTAGPVLEKMPTQLKLPLGIFVNRYLINQLEKLEPFLGSVRPTERILWMLLRKHPLSAISILFRSLWFIERAFQTSRVRDFFWYAVYIGAVALPFLTVLVIVGAFAFADLRRRITVDHPWISTALGAAGLLAPYIAAAFRELVRWLGRKRRKGGQMGEDDMARGVYDTIHQRNFPAARSVYAVMGHTHDQDIQRLPDIGSAQCLYLNTGTWIPVWPDNRPDLDGQVLFPFVHFHRIAPQEYVHEYLEWRDDRGAPAESYILEPPSK
jgi:UDP-2,3-diacylglucosamine pyrophosphatase LpxH